MNFKRKYYKNKRRNKVLYPRCVIDLWSFIKQDNTTVVLREINTLSKISLFNSTKLLVICNLDLQKPSQKQAE